MASKDQRVITVRRSTLVRVGLAVLVFGALAAGIAIGLADRPSSPPRATGSADPGSRTATTAATSSTTAPASAGVAVLSCGPGSSPHVRPATLVIGCSTGSVTCGTTSTYRNYLYWRNVYRHTKHDSRYF